MLIFTYGTLLSSFHNNYLLGNSPLVKTGRTLPAFKMISLGGFPGVMSNGRHAIVGEVYEVSEKVLHRLDKLERHPDWYVRTPITLEDGTDVQIYIYPQINQGEFPVIESGDWREYCSKRAKR